MKTLIHTKKATEINLNLKKTSIQNIPTTSLNMSLFKP